jgi:hypothetical protein
LLLSSVIVLNIELLNFDISHKENSMSRIHKLENVYKEKLENKKIKQISDFIQSVVDTDITKGKYARFLIEAFLNEKFLEEDLIGGLNSTVGQTISLFHKHKGKLPLEHRSVYALNPETKLPLYQSPGDLWNSVKQFQGELSGKELKKEEQEQIYRKTEFIYKDEETGFQIISPLTKESAQWWGKGTRWCTSAEKNNLFYNYAKDSPLLILLMPDKQKLQLWKNGNNIQFMNEADNIVSLKYIEQNWSILEPVCLWLNNLHYVPDELRTKELCEIAVKQDGNTLVFVPLELKTKELCELAVKNNGNALRYVPLKLRTKELCELAVKNNGNALRYVPEEYQTKRIYEFAIKDDSIILYNIPEYMTKEMCELVIKQNGLVLEYIPEKYITKELCESAVKQNGWSLGYVPLELRTKELCELAIKQNGYALMYIPDGLKDYNLYLVIIKQNGKTLEYIPKEYKDYNMCMEAVKQNGSALHYVPDKLITKELCEFAIKQNGKALECIPDKYTIKELYELAVKQNGEALQHIPRKHITKELCEMAVKQNGLALEFVPDEYREELQNYVKDEVLEIPIKKYQETFQEINTFFPIKVLSLSYHHS